MKVNVTKQQAAEFIVSQIDNWLRYSDFARIVMMDDQGDWSASGINQFGDMELIKIEGWNYGNRDDYSLNYLTEEEKQGLTQLFQTDWLITSVIDAEGNEIELEYKDE